MKNQFNQQNLDRMRNDPANYKWGIFYFNPKDTRIFLPKRNIWLGYTLNFANPYAYLIIFCIILLLVLARIF